MPTYSYTCDACKRDFETEQRISDPPLKKCAHCGKLKARRQITSGNFILKGGGWYSDGYGSSKRSDAPSKGKDTAASSGQESSSSSSDSSASKDPKPAPSKDPKPASSTSSD